MRKREDIILPNSGWIARPTQKGVEYLTHESNIMVQISGSDRDRNAIVKILLGLRPIGETYGKIIKKEIDNLLSSGAIRVGGVGLFKENVLDEDERRYLKIRQHTVGDKGPIKSVFWLDPGKSNFSLSQSYLFSGSYSVALTGKNDEEIEYTSGVGSTPYIAERKAVMEGLERYASGYVPRSDLIVTSAKKLGVKAIDPRRVVNYSEKQYKNGLSFVPFSEDRAYHWKEVVTFPGKKKLYIPVECLYYPIRGEYIKEKHTFTSSSGVAAAFSFKDALLWGLCEAIERDAFMLIWLNRISMPRISLESLPSEQRQRLSKIESLGFSVNVINITLDLAPVVLIAAVSNKRMPALILGSASDFDIVKAISKATDEVEQQLYWNLKKGHKNHTLSDQKDVVGVSGHMALYHSGTHLRKASFLWGGEKIALKAKYSGGKADLGILSDLLESRKIELVTADLTPKFLAKLGLRVVRAIPLDIVPISFGYGMEPLGMPRIRKFSTRGSPWPRGTPFTHPFA